MQIITIYDFLLLPVYLYIFYFLVKRKSTGFTDTSMKKIFLIAFALRMFGSVAYSLLVQYYYGYGDSFTYYVGSDFFTYPAGTKHWQHQIFLCLGYGVSAMV